MQRAYLYWIAWGVLMALAAWLRFDGLSERPIHADEATGARILAERLEGESYEFNPRHFHGPFLSFISQPIAWLKGEKSWAGLSVDTLRISVVIAGLLTVLSPLLWLREIGRLPALVAAALLASSPLIVYYNRMYIHESWLLFFGLTSLYFIYRLLERPTVFRAAIAGILVGLMFATKESFVISILSWSLGGIVYLALRPGTNGQTLKLKEYAMAIGIGAISSILVGALFFTNWFAQPASLVDAFQTFFVYETTPGHEKPFLYYLDLLIWPKEALGIWWSEGIMILLGVAACGVCFTKRKEAALPALLIVSVGAHLLIYSFIAYKTPWLMLLPWAQLCLFAALAFRNFDSTSRLIRSSLIVMLALGIFYQTKQSIHANGRFSNDSRNPYAYVPTTRNAQDLEAWLLQLNEVDSIEPLAVVGSGYWPLPWYLRPFESVGYWPKVQDAMSTMPVVISMEAESNNCKALLKATHTRLPRSLRANVSISVFIRNDLWQKWNETTP